MTRVGGMAQDAPEGWYDEVLALCKEIRRGTDEMASMVLDNKIFIQRTRGVCPVSAQDAIQWGYTGPMLRACGVNLDLRKATPYYGYESLDFDVPVGTSGDIYDRYLVRFEEMRQSVRIVEQVCKTFLVAIIQFATRVSFFQRKKTFTETSKA